MSSAGSEHTSGATAIRVSENSAARRRRCLRVGARDVSPSPTHDGFELQAHYGVLGRLLRGLEADGLRRS
jgi:hypothetical protein